MKIEWKKLTSADFVQHKNKAVAINIASIEQHSTFLPVGTDAIIGSAVLQKAAELAKSEILLLPQICYGFAPHHRFADGTVTVSQNTLIAFLSDICRSVHANGFKRLFVVNSHGGNQTYLSAAVNEVGSQIGEEISILGLRYWDLASERIKKIRETPIGGMAHAGELETSVMMYLYPKGIEIEKIPVTDPAPADPWYQTDLQGAKKYVKYVNFNTINANGHIGQPHLATAEKGKLFFQAVTEELAIFFDFFSKSQ
jgi:creatinine amidohydrolase